MQYTYWNKGWPLSPKLPGGGDPDTGWYNECVAGGDEYLAAYPPGTVKYPGISMLAWWPYTPCSGLPGGLPGCTAG
jgi:hypothetical protein